MRKLIFIIALCGLCCPGMAQIADLGQWLARPAGERTELSSQKFAQAALSKEEAQQATDLLYPYWLGEVKKQYGPQWQSKSLYLGRMMRFDYRIYGDKPEGGRSLYISLHGGGNAPQQLNDQQWENQIGLYTPDEGLYVAPRAPWNDWNMWFKPGIDELYDLLIRTAVAVENVDPNRVYLLGYSAGGDGLFRMAPRMADRWAAASMMAGHPGEASQVNLRNLPFMVWMGENDSAHDRNKWAVTIGHRMDSLHAADPQGYIHETHILKDKGHWMDREDAAAIPWMAKYERNPYPDKIVWRQEEVTLPSFYWLSVPAADAKHGMEVRVQRSGNEIVIEKNDYPELTIHLNDSMFDLDKPVVVRQGKKVVFKGKVQRNIANIAEAWDSRGDYYYLFPAKITVKASPDKSSGKAAQRKK